jgi:hypothetical protein
MSVQLEIIVEGINHTYFQQNFSQLKTSQVMWSNAHPPIKVAMTIVRLIWKTGYNQAWDNEWIFIFNGLDFQLGTANWIAVTQRWPSIFLLWFVPMIGQGTGILGVIRQKAMSPIKWKHQGRVYPRKLLFCYWYGRIFLLSNYYCFREAMRKGNTQIWDLGTTGLL